MDAAYQKIWIDLQQQAIDMAGSEPLLASHYHAAIIDHEDFGSALAHSMAEKLHTAALSELSLKEVFLACLQNNPGVIESALDDLVAYFDRDPACDNYCKPFLYYKGYLATQAYRLSHELWTSGRKYLARYIHFQTALIYGVDIHPGAKVGGGLMLDHATGIVVGETSVVGDNVSMLHGVTLGGTGTQSGQRHPKLGDGVMVSCGAKLIGDIEIGEGVKIGGGSLVIESVPPHVTVVGVPAKVVGKPMEDFPSLEMKQEITS